MRPTPNVRKEVIKEHHFGVVQNMQSMTFTSFTDVMEKVSGLSKDDQSKLLTMMASSLCYYRNEERMKEKKETLTLVRTRATERLEEFFF